MAEFSSTADPLATALTPWIPSSFPGAAAAWQQQATNSRPAAPGKEEGIQGVCAVARGSAVEENSAMVAPARLCTGERSSHQEGVRLQLCEGGE